ncbi:MAG TPA: D-glycerate dehydrogenase [Candidatus Paceibacterota bacterium]|nr:D-glycerate dehydrogenase [Candidatus Paceibacterota bacterium]
MDTQKKVLITRKLPEDAEKALLARGYAVDINEKEKTLSKRQFISLITKKDYDAVLCLLTDKIDAEVFDAAPSVKIFSNYATGFDNIDVEEAKKRGVAIANAPAPMTPTAVAEHVFALLFSIGKRVIEADRFVRAGKYKGWVPLLFLGADFSDKTLGLVGAGRIGEKVANIGRAMGLKIIYTDVARNKNIEEKGAEYVENLEKLLPMADFVSLHVPLLPSTKHLMNEKTLRLMKPTAYLINTSRGPVIDEKALDRALEEKVIAGAGIDVFEFEPKVVRGLRKRNNVVLTPHIASASLVTRTQMAQIAAENIIEFLEGKPVTYLIK